CETAVLSPTQPGTPRLQAVTTERGHPRATRQLGLRAGVRAGPAEPTRNRGAELSIEDDCCCMFSLNNRSYVQGEAQRSGVTSWLSQPLRNNETKTGAKRLDTGLGSADNPCPTG